MTITNIVKNDLNKDNDINDYNDQYISNNDTVRNFNDEYYDLIVKDVYNDENNDTGGSLLVEDVGNKTNTAS